MWRQNGFTSSLLHCLHLLHGSSWHLSFLSLFHLMSKMLPWNSHTNTLLNDRRMSHTHLQQHLPPSLLPESQSVVSLSREMRLGYLNSLSINATTGNIKHAERITRHHPLPPEICLPFYTSASLKWISHFRTQYWHL